MARSWFSDEECRAAGFSPPMIATLRKLADFVDTQEQLAATQSDVVALDGTLATAEAAIVVLDGRIDAYDALAPFVRQDQGAAWAAATGTEARTALAAYGGQTISAIPTQAEIQAIDDYVKTLSQHVVALINDARGNGTLHE